MFLGTGGDTKTAEYSEKFQGWVILNPKNYIADFGPLYRALKQVFREKKMLDLTRFKFVHHCSCFVKWQFFIWYETLWQLVLEALR